jgi:hemolysin activation/secretion protein
LNTPISKQTADDKSQSLSFFYSIPLGYHLFSVSKSASKFAQTVQGTTARFITSGTSDAFEAKWTMTALRSSSTKSGLFAAVSTRRASSFLDDVELVVQKRRLSNLEIGLQHKQLWGETSFELEFSHRRPSSFRRPQQDLPTALTGGLTLRPKLTFLNAEVTTPVKVLGVSFTYNGRLRLQATNNLTLAADQFSIGSRGSVRGFDGESVLQAEKGWYLRNEFSTSTDFGRGADIQMSPYFAVDLGSVSGPSTVLLTGKALAGSAIGLRGRRKSLSFDFSAGIPLSKPVAFKARRFNPYLSINWSF